jgi:hypothetical protein
MQNVTSISELKYAIQLLESEQKIKGEVLKEHFLIVYESFKPFNLITSTLSDIAKSPFLIDNLLGTGLGLASGYLTKKVFIGTSGSIIRKLLGSILQFGVTNFVAQNSDALKSFVQFIFQRITRKKEDLAERNNG